MKTPTIIAATLMGAAALGIGYWVLRHRRRRTKASEEPKLAPSHDANASSGRKPDDNLPPGQRPASASTPASAPPAEPSAVTASPAPPSTRQRPAASSSAPASPAAAAPLAALSSSPTATSNGTSQPPWYLAGLAPRLVPSTPAPSNAQEQRPPRGIQAPLPEPTHDTLYQRINWSDEQDTISPSPTELLAQARHFDPTITLDELAGARLAMSEHGSGTFTELAAIVDAELNRAKRKNMSLYESLTYKGTFGRQGARRPASTRQDPLMRHVLAARAVLTGQARGISKGAVMFFDPATMDRMNASYRAWLARDKRGKKPPVVSCDGLTVLEAWSFDLGDDPKTGNRCPPNRTLRGKSTLAWIGDVPGINAGRLMLMAPMKPGAEHSRRYEAARTLLERRLVA